jgi:hypothetical protein
MPKQSPEDLARHDMANEKSQSALESVTTGSYKYNRPSSEEGQARYDAEREKAEKEGRK